MTFMREIFNLDLRYYDTSLSKGDCLVFTRSPNAAPGGSIDPCENPPRFTLVQRRHLRREILVRTVVVGRSNRQGPA